MHRAKFACRQLLTTLLTTSASTTTPDAPVIAQFHTVMHRDYVRELGLDKPFSSTSRCHIKDAQRVNALIAQLVRGGCPRLLVVSDFDRTITKQHENGKTHVSSFGELVGLTSDFVYVDIRCYVMCLPPRHNWEYVGLHIVIRYLCTFEF